jgi:hypothetical protein
VLNLYWRRGSEVRSLAEKPFESEMDLERYILDNQEILGGDVSIIYR